MGDARTLQALGADGATDAAVVSLSTVDPALLKALKAGHVTIKARRG